MDNVSTDLPYIYGQLEYLEKNLVLLKKAVKLLVKRKAVEKKESLFGCLPKTTLTFKDFKALRHKLSTKWEKEWSL